MDKILWRFWYLCLVLPNIKLKGDIDGVEAAEQIHTHLDVPVIYLTAHADEDTLQRAKITEPYGYLLKPFKKRELQTAVEIALYKHRMEEQLKASEEKYRDLVENSNDLIFTLDPQGTFTFINEKL